MTAVKASEVDRAVTRRGPDVTCLLFYGPDTGRVSERARAAARAAVDQPDDPFQLVRLEGDAVAESPGRLADEVSTYGLFGGRRAVWVKPTGRNIAPAVAAGLDTMVADTLLVVEAGELGRNSPLRTLCEGSAKALALPCYADEERDLVALVVDSLKAEGLQIDRDARDLLVEAVGGDRLATRSELAKLALYAKGKSCITVEDVEAVVSDVSAVSFDSIIDAAFGGDIPAIDAGLVQLWSSGVSPAALVAIALRHALALADRVAQCGEGEPADRLAKSWRGLHFRRQSAVARQIASWPARRVATAIDLLQAASLETRRSSALAEPVTGEVLFRIAAMAARPRGRG